MATKKAGIIAGLAVAGLAAAGIITSTAAFADPTTAPTAGATASAPAASGDQGQGRGGRGGGAHAHTAATADETTKVTEAVKAKFADATITSVEKDPDGSFDARGTKADGTKVMYEVSADLATITEGAQGGRGGGKGGHGVASQDTPVTGDEATKVTDAVRAKFADVTIDSVRKDPDGSYDALGTKADGTKVMYDVSTDLATITENAKR